MANRKKKKYTMADLARDRPGSVGSNHPENAPAQREKRRLEAIEQTKKDLVGWREREAAEAAKNLLPKDQPETMVTEGEAKPPQGTPPERAPESPSKSEEPEDPPYVPADENAPDAESSAQDAPPPKKKTKRTPKKA